MNQISAVFKMYKNRIERYFNDNGRNWRDMYRDYNEKMRAEKKKKEQQ